MPSSYQRSRQQLLLQLTKIGSLLEQENTLVEPVSTWSVYEHLEHLLVADQGIVELLKAKEEPPETVPRTLTGRIVMFTGRIPRGRAKSPKHVVPSLRERSELLAIKSSIDQNISALDHEELSHYRKAVGNHPYFGSFTPAEWLKFMVIHNNHHLRIVSDITSASS